MQPAPGWQPDYSPGEMTAASSRACGLLFDGVGKGWRSALTGVSGWEVALDTSGLLRQLGRSLAYRR